jgi:hypothetical protein
VRVVWSLQSLNIHTCNGMTVYTCVCNSKSSCRTQLVPSCHVRTAWWEIMGRMFSSVCHRVQAQVLANRLNTRWFESMWLPFFGVSGCFW